MNRILIHTCCTDCVLKMLEALTREYGYAAHQIVLYFFNPNIHPESEWLARMKAVQTLADREGMELVVENWQPKKYFERIKKLHQFKLDHTKQTVRCPQCYELRLAAAAEYAADHDIEAFTSTMLTSSYMMTEVVKTIGWQQGVVFNRTFVIPQTINSCLHTSGFYKQNYCGCVFSLQHRMEEKYL